MKNPYISFYGKYKISPVHQDLRDFKLHLKRREKLYRTLGLPPVAFKDRTVLEVGPGGGYNSLALFSWGVKKIDFIEPNPKAQQELPRLLARYKIKKERWSLFPRRIEDFPGVKRYDIVIAEGFIPGLYSRKEIIKKLSRLVNPGGVLVVTCVDELSFLLELVKRLVGMRLLRMNKVCEFDRKVKMLSLAFSSHLRSLKFSSRPVCDWVADQFFNPALYGNFFSIADCIKEFGDEFMLLGSSPDMFTDYSWHKDTEFDSRKSILKQFYEKRHLLLFKDIEESVRPAKDNEGLVRSVRNLRLFAGKVENNLDRGNVAKVVSMLRDISKSTDYVDRRISGAIREAVALLSDDNLTVSKIAHSKGFASAFGRGQQYLSLARKFVA